MSVTQTKPQGAGKSQQSPLSIILLCAGVPKRMQQYGPKNTIKLNNGKSVLDYQISVLNHAFYHNDITVVGGFEIDKLESVIPPGVKLVENERFIETNTTRSAQLGLRVCGYSNVLIIHGDIIFDKEYVENVTKNGSSIPFAENLELDKCIGTNVVDGNVLSMFPGKGRDETQWGQMMYLTGKELELFKKLSSQKNREKTFMWELVNNIVDLEAGFKAVDCRAGKVINFNNYADVEKMKGMFAV